MARELRLFREIFRREAARSAGKNPHSPYHLLLHAKQVGSLIELHALPEDTTRSETCQLPDGTFAFTLGQSALGGSDPLM